MSQLSLAAGLARRDDSEHASQATRLNDLAIGNVPIGFPVVQAALSGYSDMAMRVIARRLGASYSLCEVVLDQTVLSGHNRVYEHLPEEADELVKGRVQVINLWRPIRGPVEEAPLAVADGRTVAPDELIASYLVYPNRNAET